jgi:hypothetical protein
MRFADDGWTDRKMDGAERLDKERKEKARSN